MEPKKISGPIMVVPVGTDAGNSFKVRRALFKFALKDATLAAKPTSDRFMYMIHTTDELAAPIAPVPDAGPVEAARSPAPRRRAPVVVHRVPADNHMEFDDDRDDNGDGDDDDIDDIDDVDVDEQPDVAPVYVRRMDPTRPLHENWLEMAYHVEVANLEIFWGIVHGTIKNPDREQAAHFAHGFNEIYKALDERLGYVLGDIFLQKKIDKTTCMYWIINRGYNFVETILESPDLLLYFLDTERIDMPNFNVKF